MLYYNKINLSEGIDINKSNKSKECYWYCWYFFSIHYWYFLNLNYTY